MKKWKKNLVAAGILVTVCCGIYVNWLYSGGEIEKLEDTLASDKVMSDTLLDFGNDTPVSGSDNSNTLMNYFAAVRLSRQEARDSAVTLLQEAMAYDTETDSGSAQELEQIIQVALSEAQIESLIIAKGYADCVAYMTAEGISIAVAAPEGGLQEADVAVIADIVMSQSAYDLSSIRIVEVQ